MLVLFFFLPRCPHTSLTLNEVEDEGRVAMNRNNPLSFVRASHALLSLSPRLSLSQGRSLTLIAYMPTERFFNFFCVDCRIYFSKSTFFPPRSTFGFVFGGAVGVANPHPTPT